VKAELLELAHQVAAAARGAKDSQSAASVSAKLGKLLTPPRLWPLAVILASWELSRSESNRGELANLLGAAGVPSMWPQLDLFSAQLAPIFLSIEQTRGGTVGAYASRRFLDALQAIGLQTLQGVLESRPFKAAERAIARDFPEREPARKVDRPNATIDQSRDVLALSYLLYVGWDEASAAKFLAGKG